MSLEDSQEALTTILASFGLGARASVRLREDFPTIKNLMESDEDSLKIVIQNQNKSFRMHSTTAQRCYINELQRKRIQILHRWAVYAIKEGHAKYDETEAEGFDLNWLEGIQEEYSGTLNEPTAAGSKLSVEVPKFTGTNWYEVKAAFILGLQAFYGKGGVNLTYLTRERRMSWNETDDMDSLEQRRVATKAHTGSDFSYDNAELYRILAAQFNGTSLQDVVRNIKRSHGVNAWNAIIANVEGAHYNNELRRRADTIVTQAFYDPTKHFSFEDYFQRHTRYHSMMERAGDPVSDVQKIQRFIAGIKCNVLQNIIVASSTQTQNMTFTAFYNDLHEKYRMLCDTKQLKPASIYKRRNISQLSTLSGGRGGRNGGRGRGGRRGGRGGGRFGYQPYGGRGRGGRGRGGRGGGRGGSDRAINWNVLPRDFDINQNLDFDDQTWYNFSEQARAEIVKIRRMRNQQRSLNSLLSGGSYGNVDSTSSLPPAPQGQPPARPSGDDVSQITTDNAGSAFGRHSGTNRN